MSISAVSPAWVSAAGGDVVTVSGSGLVATGAAWCRFTDISATGSTADPGLVSGPNVAPAAAALSVAAVSSGGSVTCTVPAMAGASLVAVDVSLNGQQFSAERLPLPLVTDFAPSASNSSFTVGPGQAVTLDTATTAKVAFGNATFAGITQVSRKARTSYTCTDVKIRPVSSMRLE